MARTDVGLPPVGICRSPSDLSGSFGCRRDADCDDGVCVADLSGPADGETLPLLCGPAVGDLSTGEECGDGSVCVSGVCLVSNVCAAPCLDDSDCGPSRRCAFSHAITGPTELQPVYGCVVDTVSAQGVETERVDLVDAFVGGGSSANLRLAALGVRGSAVVTTDCGVTIASTAFRTADDPPTELFVLDGGPRLNPVNPLSRPLVFSVPNRPGGLTSENGYIASVQTDGSTDLSIRYFRRSEDRSGGELSIDIFYVGGAEWVSQPGQLPLDVDTALFALAVLLQPAGIELKAIRQHDVTGMLRERLGTIERDDNDRYEELGELYTLTAGITRQTIPIFFARTVDGVLGLSGGVPGPALVPGTEGSGVVLSVDLLGSLDVFVAALVHEVGHYMGLFHTSESDGSVIEPLDDTQECREDKDTNGDGLLEPSECFESGADNVMFWAASGSMFTEDQISVLSRSLVVE